MNASSAQDRPSPHPFDDATALHPDAAAGPGHWHGHTSPAYANMIGPFGGVTAAAALAGVWQHPQRLGEPIALTVNFAGPLADGPFELQCEPVRTNRSTQHWQLTMVQGGEAVLTGTAVTATRRQTWSAVETGFPAAPPAHTLPRLPPLARARWTEVYDMRFVQGAPLREPPAGTSADSASLLWVRDEPERPLDFLSLAALADVFFPRIFIRRPAWVPIGTVSFSVYFHADAATLAAVGSAHLLAHARAHQFRNGFFDQTGELWGPGGELLAVTHQMVYFKE